MVNKGKNDRYLDKLAAQPGRNAEADKEPPAKIIEINDIFAKFEYLGAKKNSKKWKIQQAITIS